MRRILVIFIRGIALLSTPEGQRAATCCAYAGLVCAIISGLLMARTLWALPFLIACFPLSFIGATSLSHNRIITISMFLWSVFLSGNSFDFDQQASQRSQIQQQLIMLENQHISFTDRQNALQKQLALLQAKTNDPKLADSRKKAFSLTTAFLDPMKTYEQLLTSFINYDFWLLQKNAWNIPGGALLDNNQQIIDKNRQEIQDIQHVEHISDLLISNNNFILPVTEAVKLPTRQYQLTCVTGYFCGLPAWQQAFSDGWQRTVAQPLSKTWLFWLFLFASVAGIFFVIQKKQLYYREIYYKVLYSGPFSGLKDRKKSKLPSAMQDLPEDTQIVKIAIWPLGMGWWSLAGDGFIYFDLGTKVLNVFLQKRSHQTLFSGSKNVSRTKKPPVTVGPEPEAFFDTYKGMIAVKPGLLKAPYVAQTLDLYVAVDYFAGETSAEITFPIVERLLEIRGTWFLFGLTQLLHMLAPFALILAAIPGLEKCSYIFFDGVAFDALTLNICIGLTSLWLLCKIIELPLSKRTLKEQKTADISLLPALPVSG